MLMPVLALDAMDPSMGGHPANEIFVNMPIEQ
jgi:hypothetical protein